MQMRAPQFPAYSVCRLSAVQIKGLSVQNRRLTIGTSIGSGRPPSPRLSVYRHHYIAGRLLFAATSPLPKCYLPVYQPSQNLRRGPQAAIVNKDLSKQTPRDPRARASVKVREVA